MTLLELFLCRRKKFSRKKIVKFFVPSWSCIKNGKLFSYYQLWRRKKNVKTILIYNINLNYHYQAFAIAYQTSHIQQDIIEQLCMKKCTANAFVPVIIKVLSWQLIIGISIIPLIDYNFISSINLYFQFTTTPNSVSLYTPKSGADVHVTIKSSWIPSPFPIILLQMIWISPYLLTK